MITIIPIGKEYLYQQSSMNNCKKHLKENKKEDIVANSFKNMLEEEQNKLEENELEM